jgi:6-phosphogluconate dehydrogenase
MAKADTKKYDLGIIGLGSQGRHLARAFNNQGLTVIVYDRSKENITLLKTEAPGSDIRIASDLKQLVDALRLVRTVIMTAPSGPVDYYTGLLGHLQAGDLLIEAGQCHFRDCDQRATVLAERKIGYLGLGMIGGEDKECCGAVIMYSGHLEFPQTVLPLFEAVAAKLNGQPCVSYLGRAAASHFVRMIHDGVEQSLRHLVIETLELTKRAMVNLPKGPITLEMETLGTSMLDITGHVCWESLAGATATQKDDSAQSTAQIARQLEVATPTIDAAAGLHYVFPQEQQNTFATTPYRQPMGRMEDDIESVLSEFYGALRASVLITYAQGLEVLAAGSKQYGFDFNLADITRLWKGRCQKRAGVLEDIACALEATPGLPNVLCDEDLSDKLMGQQEFLRQAAWRAVQWKTSIPTTMASLDYLDFHREAWLPTNLIQFFPPASRTLHHQLLYAD